jgi:hypothetical protein
VQEDEWILRLIMDTVVWASRIDQQQAGGQAGRACMRQGNKAMPETVADTDAGGGSRQKSGMGHFAATGKSRDRGRVSGSAKSSQCEQLALLALVVAI